MRIGWIRKLPRSSTSEQTRALEDAGCQRVWIEGARLPSGTRIDRAWMLLDVRPGDTIMVTDGRVLMVDGDASPTARLTKGLRSIEDRGASAEIIPPPSDLHTRTREARDALIAHTRERIARARDGGESGRPSKPFTPDELLWIEPLWRDLRIPTNDAARDRIRVEAVRRKSRQINARLGPSGRVKLKRPRKGK
jgi:hypothetical protein